MSKFMQLDAKAPATLGAVVEAVTHLSTLSEAKILELVSAGKIADLFALKPAGDEPIPSDTVTEEELVEAFRIALKSERARRANPVESANDLAAEIEAETKR